MNFSLFLVGVVVYAMMSIAMADPAAKSKWGVNDPHKMS